MGRVWAALAAAIGLGLLAAPALAQLATPAAPQAADLSQAEPMDRLQAAPQVTRIDWVAKPSGDKVAEAYPPIANALGVEGHAVLVCKVATTGRVEDCQVTSETPPGWGFGAAALKIAPLFQMAPSTVGGSATVSDVRIPIRFALPKPPTQAGRADQSNTLEPGALTALEVMAVILLTLAAIPVVAALNDRWRRRGARAARIGPALGRGFGLVGPTLRRTPVPLMIYAAVMAVSQAVGPVPGPNPDMAGLGRMLMMLPLAMAGWTLAEAGAFRVAFQNRGDPAFRIRRLGLQIGAVEGRVLLAMLVLMVLILIGEAALILLGVLSWLTIRTAPQVPVFVLAIVPCLLLLAGVLMALRLNTFVAAWVAEGHERLAESWRATRACLLPPMLTGLIVAVLFSFISAGLVMPANIALLDAGPIGRLGVGVVYGLQAALMIPVQVGIAAYFYEALQAPEAPTAEP